MNKTKLSNHVKLIAFFLTAVILVCTFGFTVDGWLMVSEDENPSPEVNLPTNPPAQDSITKPDTYIPEFVNRLTGLEATKEITETTPLAFIMDSSDGCYGISRSDILVEIPIEDGKTRLISFITDINELWKIGPLSSSRGYITNTIKYFGGVAVYKGRDDKIKYDSCDISQNSLDLSLKEGYYYTEYQSKVYTNFDLITAGLKTYGINIIDNESVSLPYAFNGFGNEDIQFNKSAIEIDITRTDTKRIKLSFNEETGKYLYLENGNKKIDALNGQAIDFTNCFVLFADSVTYDNSQCSQMIMDTIGSGTGYYITNGSLTEIKWNASKTGIMNLYLSTGRKLVINRGNSYICYMKSSKTNNILFK